MHQHRKETYVCHKGIARFSTDFFIPRWIFTCNSFYIYIIIWTKSSSLLCAAQLSSLATLPPADRQLREPSLLSKRASVEAWLTREANTLQKYRLVHTHTHAYTHAHTHTHTHTRTHARTHTHTHTHTHTRTHTHTHTRMHAHTHTHIHTRTHTLRVNSVHGISIIQHSDCNFSSICFKRAYCKHCSIIDYSSKVFYVIFFKEINTFNQQRYI